MFSYSRFGADAEKKARRHRDALVKLVGLPLHAESFVKRGPQRNSRLQVLGVHPAKKVQKGRPDRHYIRAACRIDGRELHRDFYYGAVRTVEAAIRLATRARADFVARKFSTQRRGR